VCTRLELSFNSIMSTQHRTVSVRRICTLLLTSVLFLLLTQCGATPAAVTAEHCGGVACSGIVDCQAVAPVCASATGIVCTVGPPRECIYKLNTGSSSCPCLEHDVRLCTASGGVPGVQICTKASASSTYWAACIACPTCTA
jgi:hypothetical protein